MNKQSDKTQLTGLITVRFFGSMIVLLYHLSGQWPILTKVKFFFNPAVLALFFMLSGFILAYNYLPKHFTAIEFWIARGARIAPLYFFGLLIALPQVIALCARRGHPLFPKALPSLFLLQSWFPGSALLWNAPGWSLSAETFFYMLFPFILLPVANLFRRSFLLAFVIFWLLGTVPVLTFAFAQPVGVATETSPALLLGMFKHNPIIRLPEFILGIGLGTLYHDGWRCPSPRLVAAISTLGLAGMFVLCRNLPYPADYNAFYAPLLGVALLALASQQDMLSNRLLVLLGNCAYSIYLLHWPLQYFWIRYAAGRIPHGFSNIAYIASTIIIAVISYKLIEVPGRKLIQKLASNKRTSGAKHALSGMC